MTKKLSDWDWFLDTDFGAYSGEWIAIKGKKVVGHSRTLKKLMNLLEKNNLKPSGVLIHRVSITGSVRI